MKLGGGVSSNDWISLINSCSFWGVSSSAIFSFPSSSPFPFKRLINDCKNFSLSRDPSSLLSCFLTTRGVATPMGVANPPLSLRAIRGVAIPTTGVETPPPPPSAVSRFVLCARGPLFTKRSGILTVRLRGWSKGAETASLRLTWVSVMRICIGMGVSDSNSSSKKSFIIIVFLSPRLGLRPFTLRKTTPSGTGHCASSSSPSPFFSSSLFSSGKYDFTDCPNSTLAFITGSTSSLSLSSLFSFGLLPLDFLSMYTLYSSSFISFNSTLLTAALKPIPSEDIMAPPWTTPTFASNMYSGTMKDDAVEEPVDVIEGDFKSLVAVSRCGFIVSLGSIEKSTSSEGVALGGVASDGWWLLLPSDDGVPNSINWVGGVSGVPESDEAILDVMQVGVVSVEPCKLLTGITLSFSFGLSWVSSTLLGNSVREREGGRGGELVAVEGNSGTLCAELDWSAGGGGGGEGVGGETDTSKGNKRLLLAGDWSLPVDITPLLFISVAVGGRAAVFPLFLLFLFGLVSEGSMTDTSNPARFTPAVT